VAAACSFSPRAQDTKRYPYFVCSRSRRRLLCSIFFWRYRDSIKFCVLRTRLRTRCYGERSISLICTTGALRVRISQISQMYEAAGDKRNALYHGWSNQAERNRLHHKTFYMLVKNSRESALAIYKELRMSVSLLKVISTGKAILKRCVAIGRR